MTHCHKFSMVEMLVVGPWLWWSVLSVCASLLPPFPNSQRQSVLLSYQPELEFSSTGLNTISASIAKVATNSVPVVQKSPSNEKVSTDEWCHPSLRRKHHHRQVLSLFDINSSSSSSTTNPENLGGFCTTD
mmetsp:Transcript_16939/g.30386  ORF Transcript_16939/g.30386 Transcript_16939/m.30386 type:complete len:131 (+) Transcript_16939:887-1279(+)